MRNRNAGTWVKSTQVWQLKGKKLSKSPKQLSEIFGVEVPRSKIGSKPFWDKYLLIVLQQEQAKQKVNSPLQERIQSLETLIAQFSSEKRDCKELETELATCLEQGEDTTFADLPTLHPDMKQAGEILINLAGADNELTIKVLNSLAPKPIPKSESVRHEIDAYIESKKEKAKRGWHPIAQALDLFSSATGNIRLQDIKVEHYRNFLDKVEHYPTWGEVTKSNAKKYINTFLKSVEIDHNLSFGFIRNRKYRGKKQVGKKLQYTLEQVKLALATATGVERTALLLGLNCGFYWGDICELTPEHLVNGTHIKKDRQKERKASGEYVLVGSWLLWEETKKALVFGLKQRKAADIYSEFAKKHGLPHHKALRKTVAQLIQDHENLGETESKLYRCEKQAGVHHNNYIIPYTPAQIAKLDRAILAIGQLLGIS